MITSSNIDLSPDQLSVRSLIQFLKELENLYNHIGEYLLTANETVSTAESVTSGLLQFSFSQMKDASKFFKGGLTAYTLEEKVSLLKVDQAEAWYCDCVSPNIADSMAVNISKLFKTDWSIAVTGYATPVEESKEELYAFFSIAYKGDIVLSQKLELHSRTQSINAQLYYSEFILSCFKLELEKQKEKKSGY